MTRALTQGMNRTQVADMVATNAIVFIRRARANGCVNTLTRDVLYEIAQELNLSPETDFSIRTAISIAKRNAERKGETNLLDFGRHKPSRPQPAPTYANVRRRLATRFPLSRAATGRRSGQRWTEGVRVRTTESGTVVDYVEGSADFRADGSRRTTALAEIRAFLAETWIVAEHPGRPGALVMPADRNG